MTNNLIDRLLETTDAYPDRLAIRYHNANTWADSSYHSLVEQVRLLAAYLAQLSISKGDRVAILLENRPEWPIVFFASLYVGAIAVPINPESTPDEIQNILTDSASKILFTNETHRTVFGHSVSVDSAEFRTAVKSRATIGRVDIGPSDTACILYTSGTTAIPKGVMLTHNNLLSNCDSLYRTGIFSSDDSIVSFLPLHHTYPLTVTMLLPLIYGGAIVYPGSMRPDDILAALAEKDPTVFVAVPQIFYSFHQKIREPLNKIPALAKPIVNLIIGILFMLRRRTGLNLAHLLFLKLHRRFGRHMRIFISGGAKLDEDVARDLFKFGFTILEGYGLTETSPVLSFNPSNRPKIGSVGMPIPGVELKIFNKNKRGIGEVVARGPNVMAGYYKRNDLTDAVIKDGWFHTGDLGYTDDDGYLFLTGRLKDVIVLSSGVNVYPEEVEEAYMKAAPLRQMCIFDLPATAGAKEATVLWAVVVPDLEFFKKYGEVNLRAVIKERLDNASRTLAPHKRIMGFYVTLEDLPHTLLGKIKRYEVRDKYAPLVSAEKAPAQEKKQISKEDIAIVESELGQRVIAYIREKTGVKKTITARDSLELDFGIDSLGRIELASGLEEVLGIEIKDEVVGRSFIIKDLIVGIGELVARAEGHGNEERIKEIGLGHSYWKMLFDVPPKKDNLDKIDFKPGFGAWAAGYLFTTFWRLFFKLFYRLKVEGAENLPAEGPYILYVNHTSYFDGLVTAAALPKPPRLELFFVGFRPYFNVPVIRNLVKIGRIIPLDFASHFLEALRSSYYVLKNKRSLCLFPEGLRTLTGEIGSFKRGFGIISKESGVKLVPLLLEGVYEAWPRTSAFPTLHPIRARFGKAIEPAALEAEGLKMGARDGYDAICIAARQALVALKGER